MAPQALRKKKEKEEAYLRYLARKQRPVPRPVTPRVEEPLEVSQRVRVAPTLTLFLLRDGVS